MWSRIRSMLIQNLVGGSRTHCGTRINLFKVWSSAVFMRILWIRVDPRRNTGVPLINLVLSYREQ